LVGRYDLNSEFYRLQSASLFLNSSFRIGPEFSHSGQNGPSIFPFASVGGRFAIKPIEQIVFRTAVLDGVPVERPNGSRQVFASGDGALIVTELDYLYQPVGSERGAHESSASAGIAAAKVPARGWVRNDTSAAGPFSLQFR
jgi:porin